jgi:hypothetical protein
LDDSPDNRSNIFLLSEIDCATGAVRVEAFCPLDPGRPILKGFWGVVKGMVLLLLS